MAKKNTTITPTQVVRQIHTGLVNKSEVFRMLALAETTSLPLLLIGEPGTAKTKTVLDFAKAWSVKDINVTDKDALRQANKTFMETVYILETDEGTKSSEVKGMPDLEVLFSQNQYKLSTPIANCEVVVVNEIDKASSNIRNSLLGVMNEKFLFNGKEKIPCRWKLFIGTCNEIPKEEENSPFWDRFMLKMTVSRVQAGEMENYYKMGDRNYHEVVSVNIPTEDELKAVVIPADKLNKYLSVAYAKCSDRTLTFVPMLARAVACIWGLSVNEALIKTCEIMVGSTESSQLQNLLITPEVKTIMSKIDMLKSMKTAETLNAGIDDIEKYVNAYLHDGKLDQHQAEDLMRVLEKALSTHPKAKDLQMVQGETMPAL